jgi:uncharacterized protein (DUF1697 family)
MSSHAAFLRGVNLGPRRRIGAAQLRALFEQIGFADVATFRTSGNVAFGAGRESQARLRERIERALVDALGWEVTVFLRSAAQLQAIADREPFAAELVEASTGKLQVVLLGAKPPARKREQALAMATEDDRLAAGDRELYWLPSGGIRGSSLDFKALEALLGETTVRTKGTIEQFAAKCFAK